MKSTKPTKYCVLRRTFRFQKSPYRYTQPLCKNSVCLCVHMTVPNWWAPHFVSGVDSESRATLGRARGGPEVWGDVPGRGATVARHKNRAMRASHAKSMLWTRSAVAKNPRNVPRIAISGLAWEVVAILRRGNGTGHYLRSALPAGAGRI